MNSSSTPYPRHKSQKAQSTYPRPALENGQSKREHDFSAEDDDAALSTTHFVA